MISVGDGRTGVWLRQDKLGDSLVLFLGGGEEHVGAVSVCEPGAEPKTTSLGTHKDGLVTGPLAKAAAEKLGKTVVVIGGIHIDNPTKEELREIAENCRKLEARL